MIIPAVPCDEGCSDCCCPVPFSKREWAVIPVELKKGLDIRMSINHLGLMMPIPFSPGFLPAGIPKIFPARDAGKVMRALQEDEIADSCPFCVEHRCLIYEMRPLVCRVHGTVRLSPSNNVHNRATCLRGRVPEHPLSYTEVDQLYLAWLENKRTWQEG